jgi:hypothetical protein
MSNTFGILFSIEITHSYYTEACRDLDFIISPADSLKARNARIIFRLSKGILYALTEKLSNGSPISTAHGIKFRFGLSLNNPNFIHFTRLEFPSGSIPLYSNQANLTQLDGGKAVYQAGPLFSHILSRPNRPVTVSLKDSHQNEIFSKVITDPAESDVIPVDLRDYDPGLYLLTEKYASQTREFSYCLDQALNSSTLFGMVELKVDQSFYTGEHPKFKVVFDSREEILKYYVVGKKYSSTDLNSIVVADAGFAEESRPPILFTRVNQNNFTANDISPSLLTDANSKVVLFKSQGTVKRMEKPRRKIQLTKNTDVIIKHLPQPSPEQPNSDMIIQISKP